MAHTVTAQQIVSRMALDALNQCGRNDRNAAKRLFKQWLLENADLREAVAEYALSQLVSRSIAVDIAGERKDAIKEARGMAVVEHGVSVGVMPPRSACIPRPSPQAEARRQARVRKYGSYKGLWAVPVPVFDKATAEVKGWELADVIRYYVPRCAADFRRIYYYKRLYALCPDKDKPASEQLPLIKHLTLADLNAADRDSLLAEERFVVDARALPAGTEAQS